ncbi:GNAT family N-acetyltransferase [Brevundimonas sp. SGAir0440]|uniref:GNAT family N-acetyltransferase n=1 Tax=Brevundimonas sp. SGAir0440 TaxID=2579977 RepID=UPI0010CCF129|nr:GNAT family N-acetyltransferase [Brevundimonas sp. SGAir0440]QCQ98879.1 GNAT family N-acetyltransferase [Brevundimonas sp. SGAir0440]
MRLEIRPIMAADWPGLWPIIETVTRAGETYTYPLDMTEDQARVLWTPRAPGGTLVAVEDGQVLGAAKIIANQQGNGAHVANGSFMVAPEARGRGVARSLGEAALAFARDAGFRSMQFNAVVETNTIAVALWKKLGFEIVGTLPEAFDHPMHGPVGLHIMHRRL